MGQNQEGVASSLLIGEIFPKSEVRSWIIHYSSMKIALSLFHLEYLFYAFPFQSPEGSGGGQEQLGISRK